MTVSTLCLFTALLPLPQEPTAGSGVVARYLLAGEPAAVAADELALEMAWHQHRKDEGRQATEHLVDTELVRMEAGKAGLMPSPEKVGELLRKLEEQLRAAGKRLEDFAAIRNASRSQLEDDLAVQLAHENLVRAEVGIAKDDPVSGDMLRLWLREARQRHQVELDIDRLPLGTVARIGDRALSLLDLGRLLLRTSPAEERQRFVRQIVLVHCLEALARDAGITVSPEEVEAELAVRKRQAENNPRFRGVSFAELLKTQGLTEEMLGKSRVFRAQILQDKLVAREHPTSELELELATSRQSVLDRVGPRRRIGLIMIRALDKPNELVKRTFSEAETEIDELRQQLVAGTDFGQAAKLHSEHAPTRANGGDAGWHHRADEVLPETLRSAAFGLAVGAVSNPIATDDGYFLVKALDVEPALSDSELIEQLRAERGDRLTRRVLDEAKIEY